MENRSKHSYFCLANFFTNRSSLSSLKKVYLGIHQLPKAQPFLDISILTVVQIAGEKCTDIILLVVLVLFHLRKFCGNLHCDSGSAVLYLVEAIQNLDLNILPTI